MSFSWFWQRNIFLLVCVYLNFLLTHLKFYIGQKEDLSFQTQPWLIRPFWRIYENLALMGYQGLIIAVVSWHRAEGSWPHTQCSLSSFSNLPASGQKVLRVLVGLPPTNDMERSYFQITTILLPSLCHWKISPEFWINCTRQKDLWSRVFSWIFTAFRILTAQSGWAAMTNKKEERRWGHIVANRAL